MHVRRAKIRDAEHIARHNVLLAKESENERISYDITLEGVRNVISDAGGDFILLPRKEIPSLGSCW